MIDGIVLAEWENYQKVLKFETEKIESQLASVERRQTEIKWGVPISLGLLLVPFLLAMMASAVCEFTAAQPNIRIAVALSFTYGLKDGLLMIAVFTLPFNLFSLFHSLKKQLRHNPAKVQWEPPSVRKSSLNSGALRETNCEIEKQKLLWVRSRYFFYRQTIDRINEEMIFHPHEIDNETIKKNLKDMPLYEEIRPAKI